MSVSKDIATAKRLLDPFLGQRVVGQYAQGPAYGRGMMASMNETVLAHGQGLTNDMAGFWDLKGQSQMRQPNGAGIWCDGSASIIISTLMHEPTFRSSLTVVEQGNAKLHGHWWVIANLSVKNPTYTGSFGKNSFTIDIWGALNLIRTGTPVTTCVVYPGRALYNCGTDNTLKIRCSVAARKRKRRFCYITTATCSALGLGDDCEALTQLRAFRDQVMLTTLSGRQDVQEYYDTATEIVEGIERLPDAQQIYSAIYNGPIKRAIDAIQKQDFDLAYTEYKGMVETLKTEFLPS